ncbi:hypothetical protein BC834DRAFT_907390 [Gloeopeniophorella convolvens]|nr:hypothetical protein BC834DRAFT_907390 [Gloeopeniophorella convolvens]
MPVTVAIIAAGAMGGAVAQRLTEAGCTVLTNLDGRSEATRKRARDAGMQDVPFADLVSQAPLFLSILPPRDAEQLAKDYLAAYDAVSTATGAASPIYVDCNAVSPETVKRISGLFTHSGVHFIDASIIGGPPQGSYNPTFYASAASDAGNALSIFAELGNLGLKVSLLKEGSDVGDASALKMSYAGIMKGLTGLFATMILSAHASSPATADALLLELRASQPAVLDRLVRAVPDMLPKAYRWVGEMREISAFVGGPPGGIHEGMAGLYERIAQSVAEDGDDKRVLEEFVEAAKRAPSESE